LPEFVPEDMTITANMGRKWEILKIFGEYFKGMGTIDLPFRIISREGREDHWRKTDISKNGEVRNGFV